jgi:hypothetical protein
MMLGPEQAGGETPPRRLVGWLPAVKKWQAGGETTPAVTKRAGWWRDAIRRIDDWSPAVKEVETWTR